MRVPRSVRRLGASVALLGLAAGLTSCDDPPTTVQTTVNYNCDIKSNNIVVPNTTGTLASKYDTTAPQAVAPNGSLDVKVVAEPFIVDGTPTSYGTVTQASNLVWKVAVPANTTLTSHTIAGWANVGPGTPTSSVSGSTITITIPGPITSSTPAAPNTATLPTLTMTLKATGAAGTTIAAKIAGTSTGSPGLSFNTRVTGTLVGTLNPSLSCFPNPSPTLHSTLISNDTNAPVATITAPVANQSVAKNSTVLANYSCSDGTGVGVATCVGTVANGAAINTSTLGAKTFTVTASDNEGKVSTTSVTYTVV